MIYLDTHIVVWLYTGHVAQFSQNTKALMNQQDLYISPIVRLELQYLFEIQRLTADADTVITDLQMRVGLTICSKEWNRIISQAMTTSWTRDPFDRLIVAHAALQDNLLVSKDQNILNHYQYARW